MLSTQIGYGLDYFRSIIENPRVIDTLPCALLESNYSVLLKSHMLCIEDAEKIPEYDKKIEFFIEYLRCRRASLRDIPMEFRTREVCMVAVEESYTNLSFLPEQHKVPEVYLKAYKHSAWAYCYFPDSLKRNKQICLELARNCPRLIRFIPSNVMDYEIAFEFSKHGLGLKNVPVNLIDYNLAFTAVQRNGLVLADIPVNLIDYDLAFATVQNDGRALASVPVNLIDYDLASAAVQNDGRALASVPVNLIDYNLAFTAVQRNGLVLADIPVNLIDYDLALAAVQSEGLALAEVSDDLMDYDLAVVAVQNNGLALAEVLTELIDYDLALAAVQNNGRALEETPTDFIDYELCMAAVKSDWKAIAFVPERYKRCKQIWITVVRQHHDAIDIVPEEIKKAPFFMELARMRALDLKKCPDHLKIEVDAISLTTTRDNPLASDAKLYQAEALVQEFADDRLMVTENHKHYNHFFRLKHPVDTSDSEHGSTPPLKRLRLDSESLVEKNTPNSDRVDGVLQGDVFGGRTIKHGESYFKFLKEGESVHNFELESKVTEYLSIHKESMGLKGDIPQPVQIHKLVVTDDVREKVSQFKDPAQIIRCPTTGREYYLVYQYSAPEAYSQFAHTPNLDAPENVYGHGEEGLLKGIHDIGVLARNGILYTNILPAFHDEGSGREWLPYRVIGNRVHPPGVLEDWNASATDFPDFGYSGLRDLGDFSLLGVTPDYFYKSVDTKECFYQSWIKTQRLSLYSGITDGIVSVMLLYARLHQGDPYYHHDNPVGIQRVEKFLEETLQSFLDGYLQEEGVSPQEVMGVCPEVYKAWLKITAQRFMYMTECRAPTKDGYLRDIREHRRLNPTIFPNGVLFGNSLGTYRVIESDLGGDNTIFPVMHLLEGISCLNRGLERRQKNDSPT